MAKVTISRLFEISKYLATQSGKELEGALTYMSDLAELTLRTMRNGITFTDNIDCEKKTVSLYTSIETVIRVKDGRRPTDIYVGRVLDNTYYICDKFGWYFNSKGEVVVYAAFLNSASIPAAPSATVPVNLGLVILFG